MGKTPTSKEASLTSSLIHMPYSPVQSSPAPLNQATPKSEFWSGARAMFPLVVGATPFGLIFGTLAVTKGLSVSATLAMSAFVFAGSSQFIAAELVGTGTSWWLIVLTTFVVNLRHLLYAVSLLPHVKHLSKTWKLLMGFGLTDEAFAVAIRRYEMSDRTPHKHWYYLGGAVFMYANWQLWTLVGVSVGRQVPNAGEWGLDFAMSVTFIGMVIPYLVARSTAAKTTTLKKFSLKREQFVVNKSMVVAATVAGSTALLCSSLPNKLGLIVAAIAGITAGVISETVGEKYAP